MVKVSTSLLSVNKDILIDSIKNLNETNTDFIHYDVMDGQFVNNTFFPNDEINIINKYVEKPLDVHLMVNDPTEYINFYKNLNPTYITIHYEIENYRKYINMIKENNIKVGISIKPNTLIEELYEILDEIDLVLIMSVEPGKGGQTFNEDSLIKIKKLRKYIDVNQLNTVIEVDGGINDITSKQCVSSGADILVCGSYITNSDDYQEQINKLR
ncbi:MAG: ribulose-phosphate 3-epimerase [Firmicutes bacterium]|nr:ribulose-phosphate 3-epimerase [Bacillota bacterium]